MIPPRALFPMLLLLACGETPSAPPPPTPPPAAPIEPPAPVAEEPVAEEPIAEEPVAEEPVAVEPTTAPVVAAQPVAAAPKSAPAATPAPAVPAPPPIEEPTPVDHPAVSWTLDPGKSTLVVQVFKDPNTVAAGMSHDHVIAATAWSGTVRWDGYDPSACAIELVLPVAKLDPDAPALRKRFDLEGELSDSQRASVKKNMLAKDQLDADRYPEISFKSTSCAAKGEAVEVRGTLNIHGQAKAVSASMQISVDGGSFRAKGSFKAKGTDFGIDPFTAMMGALKNQDQLRFTLDLRGSAG